MQIEPGKDDGGKDGGDNDAAAAADALRRLHGWAAELGFSQIGVAPVDLGAAPSRLADWLASGFHGSMAYMARHGAKRGRPAELLPGTVRVITARMDYLPRNTPLDWRDGEWRRIAKPGEAVVSVYARGRDYHRVMRQRLQQLADRLADAVGPIGHRVFADSAPVMEVELAAQSGLGWRGKHTLALRRDAGSMFFLGEIYVDLALPLTTPVSDHCGTCSACIAVCPTQAIVAPYRLDARRCISYLTIEHAGPIPLEFRRAIGNRVYGCDDCQLVCPWNKYAQRSTLPDFDARPALAAPTLLDVFAWDEPTFLRRTEGSAIRRIGHDRWQRNLAVALGNALRPSEGDRPGSTSGASPAADAVDRAIDVEAIRAALMHRRAGASPLVQEHIDWALAAA